jgi:hypothetical protein
MIDTVVTDFPVRERIDGSDVGLESVEKFESSRA